MAYIHTINLGEGQRYLIEPKLFATAGGTSTTLTAGISDFELFPGAYVYIKVGTVGANATLNVNNTGAKNIYYNNTSIKAEQLEEGHIYAFIYDGTQWNIFGDLVSDTREAINNVVLPHKLTFGAGQAYVYDGSEDVTVPVYTGGVY